MIVVLPNNYKDDLNELIAGDCFELYGDYYMVTDGDGTEIPKMAVCCVDVITGELKVFMRNEKVKEVKLKACFAEDEQ